MIYRFCCPGCKADLRVIGDLPEVWLTCPDCSAIIVNPRIPAHGPRTAAAVTLAIKRGVVAMDASAETRLATWHAHRQRGRITTARALERQIHWDNQIATDLTLLAALAAAAVAAFVIFGLTCAAIVGGAVVSGYRLFGCVMLSAAINC